MVMDGNYKELLVASSEKEFYDWFNSTRLSNMSYFDAILIFETLVKDGSDSSIIKLQFLFGNKNFNKLMSEQVFNCTYKLKVFKGILPFVDLQNAIDYDLVMLERILKDKEAVTLMLTFKVSNPIKRILMSRKLM